MQRSLAFVLVLVVIAGCDSDGGGNGATAPSPIVTSLSLASAPQVSQIVQVTATASFSDGTTEDVTSAAAWSSSDTAIATVSSSGLVTALGGGDGDITATYEGVSATIQLTLTASAPDVTSISVTGPISLELGASAQFTATATRSDGSTENVTSSVTWTSSNTTVATVTASGTVTANQGGVANIRATLDGLSDEVSLTVTAPPPGPTSTGVIINEFRPRGPNGATDEFIELRNDLGTAVNLDGWSVVGSNSSGVTRVRRDLPGGIVLNPGCHYLLTNSNTPGYSGSTPGDTTYGVAVTDDGGLQLRRGDGSVADEVGMSAGSAFGEETRLSEFSSVNSNRSYARTGNDTNNNRLDFSLRTSTPQNLASSCTIR